MREFREVCDASAALLLPGGELVVANDEDNLLRVYREQGGAPIAHSGDLGALVGVPDGEELDLEGATWVGDVAYFVTSHGANRKGKDRPARRRLFGLSLDLDGPRLRTELVTTVYADLARDLVALDAEGELGLEASLSRPPKEGGLNIEGLSATEEGGLLIGLRSPLVGGRALIFEARPPSADIGSGGLAIQGPLRVDLGGRGIRGLSRLPGGREHLIIAGPAGKEEGGFALLRWSPDRPDRGVPMETDPPLPEELRPETVTVLGDRLVVMSDDGSVRRGARRCKELEAADRFFRVVDLRLRA